MTYREVIRDPDTGEVLMAVCVYRPFTDDERAAMVELARHVNQKWADEHPDDPDGAKLGELQAAKAREIRERGAARLAAAVAEQPCDRGDLPEQSDMRCPCGFEAGEHPAWRRRYCRNRRYPEHGRHSPCALCGYVWSGAPP